jgi:hypothetical protein
MTSILEMAPTTQDQGRLPIVPANWPISRERFNALSATWRRCDVWLSLWNAKGEALARDEKSAPLWAMLWNQGPAFREWLTEIARSAVQTPKKAAGSRGDGGPWLPNIAIQSVPIFNRTRVIGSVIGLMALSDSSSESFSRLCSQCQLDQKAALQLVAQAGLVDERQAIRLNALLFDAVAQARVNIVADEESAY